MSGSSGAIVARSRRTRLMVLPPPRPAADVIEASWRPARAGATAAQQAVRAAFTTSPSRTASCASPPDSRRCPSSRPSTACSSTGSTHRPSDTVADRAPAASDFAERHASHGDLRTNASRARSSSRCPMRRFSPMSPDASSGRATPASPSGTRIYQHRLAAGDVRTTSSAIATHVTPEEVLPRRARLRGQARGAHRRRLHHRIDRASVPRLLEHVGWESVTVASLSSPRPVERTAQPADRGRSQRRGAVTSLADLLRADGRDETFVLMTCGAVKRILEADADELRAFLSSLDPAQRTELHRAARR